MRRHAIMEGTYVLHEHTFGCQARDPPLTVKPAGGFVCSADDGGASGGGTLGVAADDYDRTIRTFIPSYERMVATVVHWLDGHVPAGGLVVDLGAGTGALGAAVLEALPDVRVELVDIDPNMLEVAATRCAAHAGRFRVRHARFQDELPRCHAVVASLALHHVATHAGKRELYRAICHAPTPA